MSTLLLALFACDNNSTPPEKAESQPATADTVTMGPEAPPEKLYDVGGYKRDPVDVAESALYAREYEDAFDRFVALYPNDVDRYTADMERAFVLQLAAMDDRTMKPGRAIAWIDKDSTVFAPFAERYYIRAIEVLAATKSGGRSQLVFAKRGEFDPCNVDRDIVHDMAQLADRLGKKDDVRQWQIHVADIVATGAGYGPGSCEGCGERVHYDKIEPAYDLYVQLGLKDDVTKHARFLADKHLEDYFDDSGCYSVDRDANGIPTSPEYRCVESHLTAAKAWYAKAGLSEKEIAVITDKAVAECSAP